MYPVARRDAVLSKHDGAVATTFCLAYVTSLDRLMDTIANDVSRVTQYATERAYLIKTFKTQYVAPFFRFHIGLLYKRAAPVQ